MKVPVKIKEEKFNAYITDENLKEVKKRVEKESVWKDIAVLTFIAAFGILLFNIAYDVQINWYVMQGVILSLFFLGIFSMLRSRHYMDHLFEDEAFARRLLCHGKYEDIEIQDGILRITFLNHGYMEELNVVLVVAMQQIKKPAFDLLDMVLYVPMRN